MGGLGNDTLEGGAGADVLDGGAGTDAATYRTSTSGVNVNLATGTGSGGDAQGDLLANIENVTGSAYADSLAGSNGDNLLVGGGGNDVLDGGLGNDTAYGGQGDDIYQFGLSGGHDQFYGGILGNDQIQLAGVSDPGAGSWTMALTTGSIEATSAHEMVFSQDAAGTVTLSDGATLTFEGVERIRW